MCVYKNISKGKQTIMTEMCNLKEYIIFFSLFLGLFLVYYNTQHTIHILVDGVEQRL